MRRWRKSEKIALWAYTTLDAVLDLMVRHPSTVRWVGEDSFDPVYEIRVVGHDGFRGTYRGSTPRGIAQRALEEHEKFLADRHDTAAMLREYRQRRSEAEVAS